VSDAGAGYAARAGDRLVAFADAVVAIAITLLAFDLPVPSGGTLSAFWHSFQHYDLRYLAFLVSFLAIASAWAQHHDVFRYARGTDRRMRTLHLAWLLMIVVLPFATRLLTVAGPTDRPVHAVEWGFYSLLQVLTSLFLVLMVRHLIAHGQLEPDTPPGVVNHQIRQSYGTMLGFGSSIPVFFATTNAWVLWIVAPILFTRLRRIVAHYQHRRDAAGPDAAGPGAPGDGH
jgi:uncharacterized membrane protein